MCQTTMKQGLNNQREIPFVLHDVTHIVGGRRGSHSKMTKKSNTGELKWGVVGLEKPCLALVTGKYLTQSVI